MYELSELARRFSDADMKARNKLAKATTRGEYLDVLGRVKIVASYLQNLALYLQNSRQEAMKELKKKNGSGEEDGNER